MKKTAKKRNVKSIISVIVIFIACFAFGFFIGGYMDTAFGEDEYPGKILLNIAALYVCTFVSLCLQIIVHEGGHLIFGLMSGYKFSSFRIGSLMLAKIDGKIRLKRFELSGTGGQCLMDPPEMTESGIPYKLYNLGGSLANLIAAAVFFALWLIFAEVIYLNLLLLMLAVIGLAYAIFNGIPMHFGGIDNDGMNVLSLGKDIDAQKALWIQMKAAKEQLNGKSLREMPAEWFTLPSDQAMKNPLKAAVGVMVCNRLIEEHRFTEAA
nr:M50 family metallopeptidase [Clostridia bacterium]